MDIKFRQRPKFTSVIETQIKNNIVEFLSGTAIEITLKEGGFPRDVEVEIGHSLESFWTPKECNESYFGARPRNAAKALRNLDLFGRYRITNDKTGLITIRKLD